MAPSPPVAGHRDDQNRPVAPVALTAHSDQCLGCGPDNPAGIGLRPHRDGDEVFADVVFDTRHVGAPGLAHGGAVATACDDLFGFMLYVVGEPAVTGTLQVDYHSPAVLATNYRIRAWLDHRDGRRLHLRAAGTDPTGRVCFEARAVFIVVPPAHFQRYGSPNFSHLFDNAPGAPGAARAAGAPATRPVPHDHDRDRDRDQAEGSQQP